MGASTVTAVVQDGEGRCADALRGRKSKLLDLSPRSAGSLNLYFGLLQLADRADLANPTVDDPSLADLVGALERWDG